MDIVTVINKAQAKLATQPGKLAGLNARIKIRVNGVPQGAWIFNCVSSILVNESDAEADCTISLDHNILDEIVEFDRNPQELFLQNKIKVSGDMKLVLYANEILEAFRDPST